MELWEVQSNSPTRCIWAGPVSSHIEYCRSDTLPVLSLNFQETCASISSLLQNSCILWGSSHVESPRCQITEVPNWPSHLNYWPKPDWLLIPVREPSSRGSSSSSAKSSWRCHGNQAWAVTSKPWLNYKVLSK